MANKLLNHNLNVDLHGSLPKTAIHVTLYFLNSRTINL